MIFQAQTQAVKGKGKSIIWTAWVTCLVEDQLHGQIFAWGQLDVWEIKANRKKPRKQHTPHGVKRARAVQR